MNLFALFQLFVVTLAATTATTSKTSIWITTTHDGVLTTMLAEYSQAFKAPATATTASVSRGAIGMGSIIGEVGKLKSYETTTVNLGNALNGQIPGWNNICNSIFGIILVMFL